MQQYAQGSDTFTSSHLLHQAGLDVISQLLLLETLNAQNKR